MKSQTEILKYSDFNQGISVGGVTGSTAATLRNDSKEQKYQIKLSVFNNKRAKDLAKLRRLWGSKDSVLDTENIREKIAADMLKELVPAERKDKVPEIKFIIDNSNPEDKSRLRIVSVYVAPSDENFLTPEQEKKEKAACLAEFMLMGNHDCNKGNFIRSGNGYAAIDYGKAFNSLLNAPRKFGGILRHKSNQILDFLNRRSVISFKNKTPKLWQFHSDLVLSKELADAMEKISNSVLNKNLHKIANESMNNFMRFMNECSFDENHKNHIIASTHEVAEKIDNIKLTISDLEHPLAPAFEKIALSTLSRAVEMRETAKLMKMQIDLESILDTEPSTITNLDEFCEKHRIQYSAKISWIRRDSERAVTGTIGDYIKDYQRRNPSRKLSALLKSDELKFTENFAIKKLKKLKQYTQIKVNPLQRAFIDIAQTNKKQSKVNSKT